MKSLLKLTLLSSLLALTACASIVSDSSYPVSITSSPSGASFEIINKRGAIVFSGKTPQVVTLEAGAGYFSGERYTIKFQKPGYEDRIITLKSRVDGWYLGNFLFGGPLGLFIIDPATGAMFKLPSSAFTNLTPTNKLSLSIIDINTLTSEQRALLEEIKVN